MLPEHNLNKTTVGQPPCPASPFEEKEENATRLVWSLGPLGPSAGEASQPQGMHRVLPLAFGRSQGEQ